MSGLKPFRFIVVFKALVFTGTIAKAQATFYDGKTVTVIVNAGEGVHKECKKHLGKDTNIVVKNIPGGGSTKGFWDLGTSKLDGVGVLLCLKRCIM